MQFILGNDRHQTYFSSLEGQVGADNPVRLMDAFVNKLELEELGFTNTVHKSEGHPPYSPGVLLKLYLYGYLNKIRSSRKLEKECSRNMKLQWLLQNLQPNYHTIADFRKLHAQPLQSMFRLYVQFMNDAGLLGKTTIAIDGSLHGPVCKFKAVTSKKNNYPQGLVDSQKKIDKHQQFIKEKAEKYLQQLDELDEQEQTGDQDEVKVKKEKIAEGLAKLKERAIKYDILQQQLNDNPLPENNNSPSRSKRNMAVK